MQSPEQQNEAISSPTTPITDPVAGPDFSRVPQPIRDLAGRNDFPQCTLGVHVDIQGFAGVVVEIVRDSIKVRPAEGATQRFNANRLRTLYAPPIHLEPMPAARETERPIRTPEMEDAQPEAEAPARFFIEEPDFTLPLQPISDYAGQPDFPKCAFGKHVDILDYTGVVVEIVRGSLRVQTLDGVTRSYNADVLKKLHGRNGQR